jgi:peptide-methionine (R)-S-oxide reductase
MLTYKNILDFVKNGNNTPAFRVQKTDEEWKRLLTDEQFRVARQQGT